MSKKTVMGIDAPPPRPTWGALKLFMFYIGAPVLGILFGIDLILWITG